MNGEAVWVGEHKCPMCGSPMLDVAQDHYDRKADQIVSIQLGWTCPKCGYDDFTKKDSSNDPAIRVSR